MARELDALCARFDALVAPTLAGVAPPADQPFTTAPWRRAPLQIGAAGNLAGLPAVSVPTGFGARGLPTAIQFVGRAYEENRVLAIARAYQERTAHHLPLPPTCTLESAGSAEGGERA